MKKWVKEWIIKLKKVLENERITNWIMQSWNKEWYAINEGMKCLKNEWRTSDQYRNDMFFWKNNIWSKVTDIQKDEKISPYKGILTKAKKLIQKYRFLKYVFFCN